MLLERNLAVRLPPMARLAPNDFRNEQLYCEEVDGVLKKHQVCGERLLVWGACGCCFQLGDTETVLRGGGRRAQKAPDLYCCSVLRLCVSRMCVCVSPWGCLWGGRGSAAGDGQSSTNCPHTSDTVTHTQSTLVLHTHPVLGHPQGTVQPLPPQAGSRRPAAKGALVAPLVHCSRQPACACSGCGASSGCKPGCTVQADVSTNCPSHQLQAPLVI